MPQVWQIAAGETGRDYTKLFLDYDLMFMGPGNPGAYYKHSYDALVEQGLVKKGIATQLRQFCTEINGKGGAFNCKVCIYVKCRPCSYIK